MESCLPSKLILLLVLVLGFCEAARADSITPDSDDVFHYIAALTTPDFTRTSATFDWSFVGDPRNPGGAFSFDVQSNFAATSSSNGFLVLQSVDFNFKNGLPPPPIDPAELTQIVGGVDGQIAPSVGCPLGMVCHDLSPLYYVSTFGPNEESLLVLIGSTLPSDAFNTLFSNPPGDPPVATPEPGGFLLMCTGILGLGFLARKPLFA